MTRCPNCPTHGAPPTPKGWPFELCPDHLLQALTECRERLAATVASLGRAADLTGRVASDRAA